MAGNSDPAELEATNSPTAIPRKVFEDDVVGVTLRAATTPFESVVAFIPQITQRNLPGEPLQATDFPAAVADCPAAAVTEPNSVAE